MALPKVAANSSHRAKIDDADLEFLARWLDDRFEIPGLGLRFGLDAILGLLPGAGDTAASLVSLYILAAAGRFGVSRATQARMAANLAIDYVLGCVPVIGDVFDVYWKANRRNLSLLRKHAAVTPQEARRARLADRLFVALLIVALVVLLIGSIAASVLVMAWLAASVLRAFG